MGDGQVTDLVDDQQGGPCVEAELFDQASFAFGLGQRLDQFGQGCTVNALALLDRGHPERRGQMALACARWPEKVDHLGAGDEVQLRQCHDPIPVQRRLEGEVEAFERFRRCQPGRRQRNADPAVLAAVELLREQPVDGFDGPDLSLFQTLNGVIQHLQRARHPEV